MGQAFGLVAHNLGDVINIGRGSHYLNGVSHLEEKSRTRNEFDTGPDDPCNRNIMVPADTQRAELDACKTGFRYGQPSGHHVFIHLLPIRHMHRNLLSEDYPDGINV